MTNTVIMMANTQEHASLTGEAIKADGWYGHTDGLHTVVIQVVNFTGRVYVEASLEPDPSESDWFPIALSETTPYIQYPIDPMHPTGEYDSSGDTRTTGVTFKINTLWLRARLDRSYLDTGLYDANPAALAALGNVSKITLAR